ncbi:MAG: hypothetical protein M1150_04280 [Patescibacteria group bacterium]|nr:hypothetical protein [Patescibacteria group bacterium]
MTKSGKYEINEKDIENVIRFLKTTDPDNATTEMAIAILEHLQAKFHEIGHAEPEKLLEIYNDLKRELNKNNN